MALIPGTLQIPEDEVSKELHIQSYASSSGIESAIISTHGSAIKRSVSLMIRFGKPELIVQVSPVWSSIEQDDNLKSVEVSSRL